MATIKNLAFIPKNKIKAMVLHSKIDAGYLDGFSSPLDIVHSMLPFKFKFMKETYLTTDENRIYALLSLEKDDSNAKRLNITQLLVDQTCIKYAELLIKHILKQFLTQGAESFVAIVNETENEKLKLLSDSCKFRIQANEYMFKIKKSDFPYHKDSSYEFIRFSKNYEVSKIAKLYNSLLKSHQMPVFKISEECLRDAIFVGIRNNIVFKYILENTSNNKIFGYFTISTNNNSDFFLDTVLLDSYEAFLVDILKFTKSEISKRSTNWTLYLRVRDCFINCDAILDIMKNYDFLWFSKSKIMVKDLFKTAKVDNSIYNKQIIFDAPAY